jgi:hypothetical protein
MPHLCRAPFLFALAIASVGMLPIYSAVAQVRNQPGQGEPGEADGNLGESPGTATRVASVLGIEVRSGKEENIGRIVDLLVARSGEIEAAVVEFGGFLGVGSRKIAIAWQDLHFETRNKQPFAILDIPRDQLRSAPEYKPGEPVVVTRARVPSMPSIAEPPPATGVQGHPPPSSRGHTSRRKRHHRSRPIRE